MSLKQDEVIEALFELIPAGMFENSREFKAAIRKERLELKDIYQLIPEGMFENEEEFVETFDSSKKKNLFSDSPAPSTDLSSTQVVGPTSSVSPGANQNDPSLVSDLQQDFGSIQDYQVDYGNAGQTIQKPLYKPDDPTGLKFGRNYDATEEDTFFEKIPFIGKNFVTDFLGDIIRAGKQGYARGQTTDEALTLFKNGANISEEDLKGYLAAVQNMDRYAVSDEMREYNRIYEEAGKGVWGVIKAMTLTRGQIIPQVIVSSLASAFNPTVAAGGSAVASLAAGTVAIAGQAGPQAGIPEEIVTVPGAATIGFFTGTSAVLETALTFTELLREEVEKRGFNFDEEGVLETLSSEGVLQDLRNRSVGRGLTIGIIDGLARGTVSNLLVKPARKITKAGGVLSRAQKANNALKAAGIEAIGGSGGEALGRVVADQDMDASEIILEGLAGNTSALLNIPEAATGKTGLELVGAKKLKDKVDAFKKDLNQQVTSASGKVYDFNVGKKGINVFKIPRYGVKNRAGDVTPMSKAEMIKMVSTMDLQTIRTAQFEIVNDPQLQDFVQEQKQAAQISLSVPSYIQGENRSAYIKLEMEAKNMQDKDLIANKMRLQEINTEIKDIIENSKNTQQQQPATEQNIEEVRNLAKDQLVSEGILNPTEAQINEKVNAIQESSATQVDVQESARDSQEVGEGDAQGDLTQTSEAQTPSESVPIETQTQEEVSVNVAPFYETSIGSVAEAAGLRKSPQYQTYKQNLEKLAEDIGVGIEIEEAVGGYVNNAGNKIREISNVVKLKNATLEQAAEFASVSAALSPEVQESSIAAMYVDENTPGITGQEYVLEVSDPQATFEALQEVGIDDYTLNESNNLLTLFKFNDQSEAGVITKLNSLKENLDGRNVQYTPKENNSIRSEYITVEERKPLLTALRQRLIEQGQEGTNLYQKVISAINRDAQDQGITPNQYIQTEVTEQVTADPQRVQTIIDDIIKKTRGRKVGESTNPQVVLDNTLNYLQNSKLYQQLDDVARNTLVRQLNEQLGINIKKPPSVKKILGKQKDKKVVVNERVALKDQIKAQAKAAKESAKAYKTSLQNIAAQVKSLRKGKKISTIQSNAITTRLASVNLNNPKSVENYLNYVDRVFNKVETIEKLQKAKVKAKRAKTQVGGRKTGGIPNASQVILKNLFSINPFAIPDNKIDAYIELAEQFGTPKSQVALTRNINENVAIAEDILNSAYTDAEAVIAEAPKAVDQKVYNLTQAVKEIKADTIREAEINQLQSEAQKQDARDIQKLTTEDIKNLVVEKKDGTKDYSLVEKLRTGKNQIKNGILVKDVTDILTVVDKNKRVKALDNLKFKNGKKVFANAKRDNILERMANFGSSIKKALSAKTNYLFDKIESQSTFFIDDVLGNFNSKAVYNNTIGGIGKAYDSYNTNTKLDYKKIDQADAVLEGDVGKIRRKLGITKRRNKVIEAKTKIQLYMLEREHLSNIVDGKVNKKAPSGYDIFEVTINNKNVLDPFTKQIARNVLSKYSKDGKVDIVKLEKSLTPAEKKYLRLISEVNQSLADKAVYISGSLHGNQINLLNNYTHHAVLDVDGKQSDLFAKQKRFTELPSTKSKTIVERTAGAKPMSLDPSYSARRGVQETNLDYYMTREVRTVKKTINSLLEKMKATDNQTAVEVVEALDDVVNQRLQTVFQKSFADMNILDRIGGPIAKIGYYQTLGSAPRMLVEMGTNLIMAVKNPKLAAQAFGNYAGITLTNPNRIEIGIGFMRRAKSGQTQKLYNVDELGGKMADLNEFIRPDQTNSQARSEVADKALQILKYTGAKQTAKAVDKISARLLSYGDQAISRPMWFGVFNKTFKKAVKKINKESIPDLSPKEIELFSKGESKYNKPEYEQAVKLATTSADTYAVTIASSTNPFDAIGQNLIKPSDSMATRAYKQANRFMLRFQLFEFGTAKHAINALYKRGDLSRKEASALLTGVTMRMTMYMVGYTAVTQLLDEELIGVEDEGSEDDFAQLLSRQMIGSLLSLGVRRNLGNIPALPVNFMLEHGLNEPFLGDLRDNEEYDPYKHAIVFNQLGKRDLEQAYGINLKTITRIFGGPYGPLAKSLIRIGELGAKYQFSAKEETKQAAIEELTNRMTVEVMGNLGLLPFYKDIRRIILKDMFGKKKYTQAEIKAFEDFIKNDPALLKDNIMLEDDTLLIDDNQLIDDDMLIQD